MTSETEDLTPGSGIPGNRRCAVVITLERVEPAFYTGWDGASEAVTKKDKAAIMSLLKKASFEIADLSNKRATRENVVTALEALANETVLGDEVVVYFSCHGARLPDRNRDEARLQPDGAWCLYNGMFVDDELVEALTEFRKGVRVVVISESCFAGTIVGEDPDRQERGRRQLLDDERGSKLAPSDIGERVYEVQKEYYDEILTRRAPRPADVNAAVLFLSACGRNELARVDKDDGSVFTRALVDVWCNRKVPLTYEQLFEQVYDKVTSSVEFQHPVMTTELGDQERPLKKEVAFGQPRDDDQTPALANQLTFGTSSVQDRTALLEVGFESKKGPDPVTSYTGHEGARSEGQAPLQGKG